MKSRSVSVIVALSVLWSHVVLFPLSVNAESFLGDSEGVEVDYSKFEQALKKELGTETKLVYKADTGIDNPTIDANSENTFTARKTISIDKNILKVAADDNYEELTKELAEKIDEAKMGIIDVFMASNKTDCLNLWIEGLCMWLIIRVTMYGVEVEVDFTVDISHHNPDFVVAAYPRIGGSPLEEPDSLYESLQTKVSKIFLELLSGEDVPASYEDENQYGGRMADTETTSRTIAMFSEVDVIGHPGNIFSLAASSMGGDSEDTIDPQGVVEALTGTATSATTQGNVILDKLQSNEIVTGTVGDTGQWGDLVGGAGETDKWEDENVRPADLGVSQLFGVALSTFANVTTAIDLLNSDDSDLSASADAYLGDISSVMDSEAASTGALADIGSEVDISALGLGEGVDAESALANSEVDTDAAGQDAFNGMLSDTENLSDEEFSEKYGEDMSQEEMSALLDEFSSEFESLDTSVMSSGSTSSSEFSFCPKDTSMLTPHYLSGFNVLGWRYHLPELAYPQSYAFPKKDSEYYVGKFDGGTVKPNDSTGKLAKWANKVALPDWSTWGNIYPRSGWVAHGDEVKNRALAAYRAVHVVTREDQLHLYNRPEYEPTAGMEVISYGDKHPMEPHDLDSGAWQMIYPKEMDECTLLQDSEIDNALGEERDEELTSTTGAYIYNVWRKYQCCVETSSPGFKIFLGRIPIKVKVI